ncbi:MAG: gliding motility-associated C-terminal domain-containing protein [Bacteroidetes bacterium]|nr:gliding motility-associated C-terminal domain-containing protein [Bacteroidota bacterium]
MRIISLLKISLIFLLFFSQYAYSQGGDNATAAAASPITLPFSAAGTTCGHVDNYNPLSLYGITPSGKDWVYYFCATTTGTVDIFMNNAYDYIPAIMVYSVTPNAGGTNWFATSFTGGAFINSLVSVKVTAGTCYYVIVDNDYLDDGFNCFNYNINIQYHATPPAAVLQPACTNMGYDDGTLGGWTGTTGSVSEGLTGSNTPKYNPLYFGMSATQHSITSGAGVDPYGSFPIVNPAGSPNSLRLGDMGTYGATNEYFGGIPGAGGASMEQKFTVTASNALFVYYYAVVIQNALSDSVDALGNPVLDGSGNPILIPHKATEQPFFKTDVFDCSGNPVLCGQYLVTGGPNIPGFALAPGTTDVYYKTWTPVAVDLTPFIGTCVTVRYTVGDCTVGGHFAYAYVDAVCSPLAITGINKVCPTKSTVLTAPTGLFTYSWTPGAMTTQSITVTPTTTTTYTCELTSYTNCKTFLTYSVSLFPDAVASINSATVCNGTSAALTSTLNNGAGTYSWAPSGGAGANANVTPASTTIYTLTYTDGNGCKDTAMGRVTVNPLPTMLTPANITVCHNGAVAASAFSSTVAGTTFSWTNTNPAIGLGATGAGDTPGFTGTNTGASSISGVISVTPTANLCVGNPVNYTITVNPIPNVNPVSSATYCAGATVPSTSFSGSVTSTTYSWSNTNTSIGLGASGTGNIASFGATNTGASGISGVITVTPSANSCIGTPTNYSVLVNPIPNVNAIPSATYCAGATVPLTSLTGSVTSTTFSWANTNTAIGLGASGTGDIASYTATNNGASGISGVITITPSANSCIGTPTNFTVLVNPIPNVNAIPSATYCAGATVPLTSLTGSVTSTTFSWANTNTAIGLGASGTGDIASYTATNNGVSGISGVITITPSANSCVGTPTNYSVLVNPIPNVNAIPNASYCAGASVPTTTFSGNISEATYNWSNSNTATGMGASGTGNINSYTASNSTGSPINGVVVVVPSVNSCIGTPTSFTIIINPNPLAPTVTDPTICPSSSATLTATAPGGTYSWYDSASGGTLLSTSPTYTTPGLMTTTNYYVNATNIFGCIGPMTTVTVTVLNFLPVSASPNQTICIGASATLGANPNGAGYVYSWDSPGNTGFSTIYNPVVTPTLTTNYTVTVTSPNGCTGVNQTQVFVNPLPIADAGNPIAFCNGQSGTIGAASTTGYTYSWLPTTGLSSSTISNPVVTLTNSGSSPSVSDYTVTAFLNGCQASSQVQVTVNPLPVSSAGNPITLCNGQSGAIGTASNPNYTYSWSPALNLNSSTASNPTVNGLNTGFTASSITYTVTTTETSTSCQSNDHVTVTVLPLPTVDAGTAVTTCEGTSNIQLNGMIGGSVTGSIWSGGTGSFNANNTILNPTYNPTSVEYSNGSVTLTLTAIALAPCQNVTSTVQISFYKKPVINFIVDNPKGCPEHCVTFTDQSSVALPDYIQSWSWDFGDGTSGTSQNPHHCYSQSGLYSVTLTAVTNHLCSNTLSIPNMVEVYQVPDASFYADPPYGTITDPNISFHNTTQGAVSYSWGFGDQYALGATNSSTVTNPSHAYTNSGEYVVTLIATSINGCEDRTSVTVEIKPEFTFYIPNAFTPENNDGVNDIFTGMGIGIDKYEMWIFDRWGAMIYYSDDIHKGWDGTKQGKKDICQQDVYIWKVKLTDVFGKKHEYIGHVTLLK